MQIDNINIESQYILITPEQIKKSLPMTLPARKTIADSRKVINNILEKKDPRLFVVVGPCSIHDIDAALDYAKRLKVLSDQLSDVLYISMRVYFEKPRTTIGWKGLINDPKLDNSFNISEGLQIGRKLLLDIVEIGLPTSTEVLDPISPQYLQDLISWSAVGARTVESQTHREMASGISSPVGFKNSTDGSITIAINALQSASAPHCFLGINNQGQVSTINTKGNPYGHIVLRGGINGANYYSNNINEYEISLNNAGLTKNIMVDCSHANSNKDASQQPLVISDIKEQIINGNNSIIGLMIESNINFGNQKLNKDSQKLKYGISITDECIDWDTTEKCLVDLANDLREVLPKRISSSEYFISDIA